MRVATSKITVPSASPCPVYAWCDVDGPHRDHVGGEVAVTSPKNDEDAYLIACVLHLDGDQPLIGLEGSDLDASQARVEAAKLHRFARQLEHLASLIDAHPGCGHEGRPRRAGFFSRLRQLFDRRADGRLAYGSGRRGEAVRGRAGQAAGLRLAAAAAL